MCAAIVAPPMLAAACANEPAPMTAAGSDSGADQSVPSDAGDAGTPPTISAESVPVTGVTDPGIGPERQSGAAVSVGEAVTLVAWADDRAEPLAYSGSDIVAVRYAPDGTPLDLDVLRIAPSHAQELMPRIAFGQGTFLVVWWAITRSPNGSGGDGLVRAARVSPDGTVLDPEGIELASNAGPPVVAFVKDRFLVAFEPNAGGPLRVVPVSTSGAVGATVAVADHAFEPSIASDGSNAILAYVSEPSVTNRAYHLALLGPDGTPQTELSWPTPLGQPTAVAGGPTGFVAAWTYDGQVTNVRRLDSKLKWVDPSPIQEPLGRVSMARDTNGYLLAGLASGVGIRRLDDSATTLGPVVALPKDGPNPHYPEVASSGANRAVVWADTSGEDIHRVRIDASGAPLDAVPQLGAHGRASQLLPALGRLANAPFLAFVEASRLQRTLRYALLDQDGSAPAGAVGSIPGATAPAIATGTQATLLVWESAGQAAIEAAFVQPNGSLGKPIGVASGWSIQDLTYYVERPHVAATSNGFVVVYHYFGGDTSESSLHAVTLSADGDVLGTQPLGSGTDAIPIGVGASALVALRGNVFYSSELTVRTLSNAAPVVIGKIAPGELPALASDGGRALVVWTDDPTRRVRGRFIDAAGVPIGTWFEISPLGVEAVGAFVAFDGVHFVVAWREHGKLESDVHGARVTGEGSVIDLGFVISAEPGNELTPTLVSLGAKSIVAYGRFDPALQGVRVHTRSLTGSAGP